MSDLDKFENKVKASLEADVQNLDAETRQQLATARRKALNQPQKTTWLNAWFKKDYWLPAGSLALCSLLALFILVNPSPQNKPNNVANNQAVQQQSDQLAALELLDGGDDTDAPDDPDFYLWANEMLNNKGTANAA